MRDFIKNYLSDRQKILPKELNQKIKLATVTIHRINTDYRYLASETFFDLAGNKVEFKSYFADKILAWDKFFHDNDDNLIKVLAGKPILREGGKSEEDFLFTSEFVMKSEESGVVHINEVGQKIVSIFTSSGKLIRRKVFNRDNVCIEIIDYANEVIINRELYDYSGQLMEARRFRSDGTPLNYTVNTFNDRLQLCRSQSISRTGFITHDTVLKYNDLGLLSEIVEHPRDPKKAFADLNGGSSGWNHRYHYTKERLLDIDDVYQCGKHVRSHKYHYEFW